MQFSRRKALATALSAFVAGPGWAAAPPLEAQGGQYASFDGAQLFYRRMGSGPPVVLLHSFLNDGPRIWFNTGIAQGLVQAGFSIVAPDFRTLGLSSAPPGPYPKDVLAMDVEALLKTLKLKSYRMFGYAMGSRTAMRLMARGARPERCVLGQGHQRQDAAFALVVGPHDDRGVFHRHHDDQRPQHQGNHADHRLRGQRVRGRRLQALAEGVKRAGADVAEHHAHGAKRQAEKAAAAARGVNWSLGRPRVSGIGQSSVARHGP